MKERDLGRVTESDCRKVLEWTLQRSGTKKRSSVFILLNIRAERQNVSTSVRERDLGRAVSSLMLGIGVVWIVVVE